MTINMNGTTAMHMCAITFIGTAAGLNVSPGVLSMAVITLNVIGDAATNVIVCFKEKVLDVDRYNA